jgi:hypothetical protein
MDLLRTLSCIPGMQAPPASLPISYNLSIIEVESTGILREDKESIILDTE